MKIIDAYNEDNVYIRDIDDDEALKEIVRIIIENTPEETVIEPRYLT